MVVYRVSLVFTFGPTPQLMFGPTKLNKITIFENNLKMKHFDKHQNKYFVLILGIKMFFFGLIILNLLNTDLKTSILLNFDLKYLFLHSS